jgi:hypothetical protein
MLRAYCSAASRSSLVDEFPLDVEDVAEVVEEEARFLEISAKVAPFGRVALSDNRRISSVTRRATKGVHA